MRNVIFSISNLTFINVFHKLLTGFTWSSNDALEMLSTLYRSWWSWLLRVKWIWTDYNDYNVNYGMNLPLKVC